MNEKKTIEDGWKQRVKELRYKINERERERKKECKK